MCQRCPDTHFVSDVLVPHRFAWVVHAEIVSRVSGESGNARRSPQKRDRDAGVGGRGRIVDGWLSGPVRRREGRSRRHAGKRMRNSRNRVHGLRVKTPSGRGPNGGPAMTSANPRPARLTSAGAILRRELAARGWTQRDLAEVIGRPAQAISEIVQGSKRITAETALELAAALGTSAEVWLRLDASHWLRLAEDLQEMVAVRRSHKRRG